MPDERGPGSLDQLATDARKPDGTVLDPHEVAVGKNPILNFTHLMTFVGEQTGHDGGSAPDVRGIPVAESNFQRAAGIIRRNSQSDLPETASAAVTAELWFEDLVVLSHLVTGERRFRSISTGPDDDKCIAAAIEGQAAFVVAGDSDLLDVREYEGIRFVSPRVFLDLLGA